MAKFEKQSGATGCGTVTDKADVKPVFKKFLEMAVDFAFRGHGPAAQGIASRVKKVVMDDALSEFRHKGFGWFKNFTDQLNFTTSVTTSCVYPKLSWRTWPEDNGMALTVSGGEHSQSHVRAVMGVDGSLKFQWHVTAEELDRCESPFRDFLKYLYDLNAGRVTHPREKDYFEDDDDDDDDDQE